MAMDDSTRQMLETAAAAVSPTETIGTDLELSVPREGVALCLSGGGYRAMLFHLGTVWRLAEAGWLPKLDRVSSVSGGSITAAALAVAWTNLRVNDPGLMGRFESLVVRPVRDLAGRTVDVWAVGSGVALPGSIADYVENAYNNAIFNDATLQDLPDWPFFSFNATNVQTGALWRFTKRYMADWKVGQVVNPTIPLARAVAASSAFPPFLSPVRLTFLEGEVTDFPPGKDGRDRSASLHREPYTREAVLTDGGVYDNLGLETAWKKYSTVLVSDAGGALEPQPDPKGDWARHTARVFWLTDGQVRARRKSQVNGSYRLFRTLKQIGANMEDDLVRSVTRKGSYWSIRGTLESYSEGEALPCPPKATRELADTPTRLKRLDETTQERLINWGYAACDARMRRYVVEELPEGTFPYPGGISA